MRYRGIWLVILLAVVGCRKASEAAAALVDAGNTACEQQDYATAIRDFDAAIQRDPNSPTLPEIRLIFREAAIVFARWRVFKA